MEYNAHGHPTRRIDPVGRETRYTYAENGIDPIKIQQKTATGWDTVLEVTWNTQHRPLTIKDAAGRVTSYTWTPQGELASQTNALNQTTNYQYDAAGRLTQIINPLGHAAAVYT
jgi:YD repeat-containing protein